VVLFPGAAARRAYLSCTLLRARSVMIVARPCAVVLASMPRLLSAIATAGRHGVLVKSAVDMDRLGHVVAVARDKTGTLPEGSRLVTEVGTFRGDSAHGLLEDG
ncbi:heavy metal translocating P-type ATPase, partial [Streptomyces sp. BE303]|nr:heavy metal translocating P-type ATPase [Streptomyces sp. BE303]